MSERITSDGSASVPLQAVDKNEILPSVIMPFDTTMKITTKTVSSSSVLRQRPRQQALQPTVRLNEFRNETKTR